MLTVQNLVDGFRELSIPDSTPVIAHVSLSSLGPVGGGAKSVTDALIQAFGRILMPAFTYKTMIIPETGPANNGMTYGSGRSLNRMAQFYSPSMAIDRTLGIVPEMLRHLPGARRSTHPILSFMGVGVDDLLAGQSLTEPLAPIRKLREHSGWVVLLGVDHTVNTSLHEVERQAGRRQFIRWGLTEDGIVECPGFPGCSDGFEQVQPHVRHIQRQVRIGQATVTALPLQEMTFEVLQLLHDEPEALLCANEKCERCMDVRKLLKQDD